MRGNDARVANVYVRLRTFAVAIVACAGMMSALTAYPLLAEDRYGPFGPEGARMREQLWVLPSADANVPLRATVFRPVDDGEGETRRPLVIVNHGTSEATRLAVAMPVYYWLSRWFVERGYVVVLPQRRGHGATGGDLAESIGNCDRPDHAASGRVAASDIAAVIEHMRSQPFVDGDDIVVTGISTGGWASLALANANLPGVRAIVNFAGGRGGHAHGVPGKVCGVERLAAAAQDYAAGSNVPTAWFYSRNDSYFGPALAKRLAAAWTAGGGDVSLHLLPAYGNDGHAIADDRAGWDLWGRELEAFLAGNTLTARRQPAGPRPRHAADPLALATSAQNGAR